MRWLSCAAALGLLLACGHYGPPVRSAQPDDSEVLAPAEAAECEEEDEKEQEPRP